VRTCSPLKVRACSPTKAKARACSPLKERACSPLKVRMHSPLKARTCSPLKARTCSPLKVRTCGPLKVWTCSPLMARTCSPLMSRNFTDYTTIPPLTSGMLRNFMDCAIMLPFDSRHVVELHGLANNGCQVPQSGQAKVAYHQTDGPQTKLGSDSRA